jgi:hypothetical protein
MVVVWDMVVVVKIRPRELSRGEVLDAMSVRRQECKLMTHGSPSTTR